MSVFRALHLSDLHIGDTYLPSQDLAYKISNDIARNGIRDIRSILVTGDIFHGPAGLQETLIEEASDFFKTLINELNENQSTTDLTEEDVLFVPGNHDMMWSDDPKKRWEKYRRFLKTFYGNVPDYYDLDDFSFFRPYSKEKLVFLGFNSCGLEKKKLHNEGLHYCNQIELEKYQSKGIDKSALMQLLEDENPIVYEDYGEIPMRQLSIQRRKMSRLSGYQAVALFHHHFFLFPDIATQLGDADVLRNHSTVVRDLRSMEVKTVLHGHKHFDLERPFINDDYYETSDNIIDVFAGGSVGVSRGLQKHTFSIIDFYPQQNATKLQQQKFVYNEDALEPIRKIQIPPASTPAQVVKLLDLLKVRDNDSYEEYRSIIMSNMHLYRACCNIIEWVGCVLTGYPNTYRYLDQSNENIISLLYAIATRTLTFIAHHSPGEKNSLDTIVVRLSEFFRSKLSNHLPDDCVRLFDALRLEYSARICNELLDKSETYTHKQHLSFTMVGIFFADLYLVLTEYADDFYKQISHKANINLAPNQFHTHIPAPQIELRSDPDRRSAYVKMWCDNATAHKLAVLFVKEFDLIVNKFEDFFKLVDLKLYYLLPKIEKDVTTDALDNYNFEAYIPTLLPLLVGENIYPRKEVFARELIQNSIDAISVREAVEGRLDDTDRVINITLGKDKNNRRLFKIADRGTGMDRYKVERYFTSIGRSFYSGDDYAELNIGYKPISSFGIGFLSSFMVCKEIDVRTKSFDGAQESLKLHIPNYDGCFFIERTSDTVVGTEVTLYLDDSISDNDIIQYIKESMQDIKYDIVIEKNGQEKLRLPAHCSRQPCQNKQLRLFVPLLADGTVGYADWKQDVLSGKCLIREEYGLFIDIGAQKKDRLGVLNAGISTGIKSLRKLLGKSVEGFFTSRINGSYELRSPNLYNQYIFNFPSNWIQLDVSREKMVGFSAWMKERHGMIGAQQYILTQIRAVLTGQISSLLSYCKENELSVSAATVDEVCEFLRKFSPKPEENVKKQLEEMQYTVQILFSESGVKYRLLRNQQTPSFICYESESARKRVNEVFAQLTSKPDNHQQKNAFKLFIPVNGFDQKRFYPPLTPISLLLSSNQIKRYIKGDHINEWALLAWYVMAAQVYTQDEYAQNRDNELESTTKSLLLDRMSISAVERENAEIFVTYEEICTYCTEQEQIVKRF